MPQRTKKEKREWRVGRKRGDELEEGILARVVLLLPVFRERATDRDDFTTVPDDS